MVGNRQYLHYLGVIHGTFIAIQGFSFSTTIFVVDFHGSDLVLGVAWLATLGISVSDYVKHMFEFLFHGNIFVGWTILFFLQFKSIFLSSSVFPKLIPFITFFMWIFT